MREGRRRRRRRPWCPRRGLRRRSPDPRAVHLILLACMYVWCCGHSSYYPIPHRSDHPDSAHSDAWLRGRAGHNSISGPSGIPGRGGSAYYSCVYLVVVLWSLFLLSDTAQE